MAAHTETTTKTAVLTQALRERIAGGQLTPGAPIPSEAELGIEFGLSRGTVRNAVAQLRAEGWIVSYHGKGSFVRANVDRPTHNHTRALTTTPDGVITDVATDQTTEVGEPSLYRDQATADLALTLGVAEHSPVFVHDRLLADLAGRRQAHRLYIPLTIAATVPALEENPFVTPQHLYRILTDAGHTLGWTEYIRARVPGPDDVSALRIPEGGLLYVIRRVTCDTTTGTVLAVEETRTSAHDTQVEVLLMASPVTMTA
ncbi:GntR family transcriptional regulator [Umezawaea sp. Da 62-37]|uniref:GntR family transcriptional regulator n=1 Tax=Umezawaea sp. Da 62-37 TaxID=3075927 RepID=UPI0028F7103E|nr:GntR family transcriptional regulator [Umezawaea sp. Da 62-37]WNV83966.1 GntR family transcriptional regulator [Umezawaea sp. Da 62-37]